MDGGELPEGALPDEAGEQMGDPGGNETKALEAADEASAGAGLMIEEIGSAGPRSAGCRERILFQHSVLKTAKSKQNHKYFHAKLKFCGS